MRSNKIEARDSAYESDFCEIQEDFREIEEAKSGPPVWARPLAWAFARPLRLALTIACLDIIGASLAQLAAFIFCKKIIDVSAEIGNYVPLWIMYNMLLVLFVGLYGGYKGVRERRSENELRLVTMSNILALSIIIVIDFVVSKYAAASRYIFLTGFIFSWIFTLIAHFGVRELLKKLWQYGLAKENLLIVGDSERDIRWFLGHLHIQRFQGFEVLGYLAEEPSKSDLGGLAYLGDFQDLKQVYKQKNVEKILLAMNGYSNHRHQLLTATLEQCADLRIPVLILSHIVNDYHFNLSLDGYSGIFSITSRDPAYTRPLFWFSKRCIDIVISLLVMLLTTPLWLVIGAIIKLQDGGKVFFKHRLVGRGGEMFNLLKFRSMVMNSEEILKSDRDLFNKFRQNYKLENDPRVTRIGKWLRKLSLDELPQLINVLKGDMSLVGLRPIKEEELPRFGDFQKERLKIRPGLTGYWQVNGRSTTTYEDRVRMDKFYMQKCNIWMDLIILLKTPFIVFKGHGAV